MKLAAIKTAVTSKAGRQLLRVQKNSPHILFGAGVVGVVATAVMASRATLQVNDVLVDHEVQMGMIQSGLEKAPEKYSETDAQRDRVIVYSKSAMRLVRLYGPTVAVGVASIACLTGSHRILSARNVALSAAYSALEVGFNEYRARVVSEFGEEKDREFRFASEEVEFIEETKKGPQPKDVTRVDVKTDPKIYARFFGEGNPNWQRHPEYNVMFLRTVQDMMNDKLYARGHVFLNEVYDALGLDRSKAGAVVGWLKDGSGDCYIDFRIFTDEARERFHDFVIGEERQILLDFNVDGVIYDKL